MNSDSKIKIQKTQKKEILGIMNSLCKDKEM